MANNSVYALLIQTLVFRLIVNVVFTTPTVTKVIDDV